MLYTKAEVAVKEGKIEGVASTSVIDRQNEIVSVDGWDLKNFKKAPRLLWAHDHSEPAIGKVTKIFFDGEGKRKSLKFEAVFQEVTEKARAIKKLVEDGFINTFSVGFKPLEMDGHVISKQELLEISVVNVPANPDAMLLAVKSLEDEGIEKSVIDEVLPTKDPLVELQKQVLDLQEQVKAAQEKAELAVKGLKHLNPQRSKHEVATTRLALSKVIARTTDKLLESQPNDNATSLKVIKRSSDLLIRSMKGDL